MSLRLSCFFLACFLGLSVAQDAQPSEVDEEKAECLLQSVRDMTKTTDVEASHDSDAVSGSRRRRRASEKKQPDDKVAKRLESIEQKLDDLAEKVASSPAPPPQRPSSRRGSRPSPPPPSPSPPPPPSSGGGNGGKAAPPSAGEGKVPVSLTDRWINAHNYWRCIHNTDPVIWDADIAAGAQQWVDEGHRGHADCYNLPNPQGPTGENIAGGTGLSPEMASAMWHDESPERGPNCGGHCTAMLWKSANKLGCGFKKPEGGGMMAMSRAVCRYGGGSPLNKRLAANFGGSSAKQANVAYPDNSRADACNKKWPPAKGLSHTKEGGREGGGGGSGGGGRGGSMPRMRRGGFPGMGGGGSGGFRPRRRWRLL